LKFSNGQYDSVAKGQFESPCQVSWRLIKPLLIYRDLLICSKWRHCAILDLLNACSDYTQTAFAGL